MVLIKKLFQFLFIFLLSQMGMLLSFQQFLIRDLVRDVPWDYILWNEDAFGAPFKFCDLI